jgi:hypothetical protein
MVVGDWVNSSYFALAERAGNLRGLLTQVSDCRNIPITLKIPLQIAEGANRRRKLVLTPDSVS